MKFPIDVGVFRPKETRKEKRHNSMSFEVAGVRYVVENNITHRGDGTKTRVGKTFKWNLVDTKKGLRWLKLEMDDNKVLDGKSPVQMHTYIEHCMTAKSVKVWFSGDTCNIEHDEDLRGELLIKAKTSKEQLIAKVKASMGLEDIRCFPTQGGILVIGTASKGGENL